MFSHTPINLATGDAGHAKQYKDVSFVYSILINSLDDCVCSGLSAHGLLKYGQKPWELYDILRRYCNPTPAFVIDLIDDLGDMRIERCATPLEFTAYVDFTRLCIEGDGYSMALTCILFESIKSSDSEVSRTVRPITKAMDWVRLLEQVRELANPERRSAEGRSRSSENGSRRDTMDIDEDLIKDEDV
ncbi:hypothetical protein LY78DRAFT_670289 [Colletotrichum sublineola]|uniref:Uncharacterized protein n=1 Tax=Colletotrichum sublineola TaxID=1173701 RepID=A0A066XZ98_COLSU|nr:hypothetical protein LY78DRAFT_670289 [Colletotrichum sublineola]KDN71285.1 hypothetical protein CSUB01_08453 [Colletotrichum sublineola]